MDVTAIVLFFILMFLTWVSFSIFLIEKTVSYWVREKHNMAVASHLGGTGATARSEDKEPK